ncbi:plasmid stabilization system protein [Opitutaceae bacterium TAV1]|nr:plasmid stabilization system protein [Opitutaceae bacterium TAV1]
MGLRVILTPQSQADLKEIVRYVARDSRVRARDLGNTLIDRALRIGEFPHAGKITPESGDPEVREIVHGAWRIIYEVLEPQGAVYVLRFWHGARGEPDLTNRSG